MSNGDFLRIGDAEREQAAAVLGEHFVAGRITHEEHTDRLERVWAARTRADIVPLFSDLPVVPPAYPTPSGSHPAFQPPLRRHRSWPSLPLLLLGALWLGLVLQPGPVFGAEPRVPWLLVGLLVWLAIHRRHRRPRHQQLAPPATWRR